MRNNNKDNTVQDLLTLMDFGQICEYFCLMERDLLALLEVDRRTLKSWIANDKAPKHARKLVIIHGRGYLPPEKDWAGFTINGDTLHTPDGRQLTTGEILSWFYKDKMIDSYQQDLQRLRAANAKLKAKFAGSNDSVFREDGTLKQLELI